MKKQEANFFFSRISTPLFCGRLLLALLVFLTFDLPAQLILPTWSNTFDQYPNFNAQMIRAHKIRTLTFDILDKKDFQAGKDQGLIHHYDFDTSGRLTRFYYTSIAKIIVKETYVPPVKRRRHKTIPGYTKTHNEYVYDTISTRFFYDASGKLILKRYNEGLYYESTYYDYDAEGRVLREMRCKETNVAQDKNQFTLGVQNVISEEKFEYQKTGEQQYKKKCLNDEGRVFREVIVNTNAQGQPLSFNENFTVTWISQVSKFRYDEFGRMKQRSFESNTDGTQAIRDTFEYDNKGNITWERQYKNGILLNERSYLFDEKNELVTSFVIRDHIGKSMRITKLLYEYYREPEKLSPQNAGGR